MSNLDPINKYFESLFTDLKDIKTKNLNEVYPNKNETKSDFINRFMRTTAKEYPDVKQRYAVANSYWERRDKKDLKENLEKDLDFYVVGGYSIKDLSKDTQEFIKSHTQITTWPLYRFDNSVPKDLTVGTEIRLEDFKSFSKSKQGRDRIWEDIQENEKDISNYCLLKTSGKVRIFDINKHSSNTNYSYQDEVLAKGWFKIVKIEEWEGILQYTITQSNILPESYLDQEEKISDLLGKNILYHATYKPYWEEIKKEGFIKPGKHQNWSDIFKTYRYIYLSTDYNNAYSYAETAENIPEEL